MATARSSQSRKRVQQIVDDAAEKIAAESDLEEEVVVVVEELPPGESARRRRARVSTEASATGVSTRLLPFSQVFDPRKLTEETFRLAEEVLSSQKDFVLRVVESMERARGSA